jgi:hypothetical protein
MNPRADPADPAKLLPDERFGELLFQLRNHRLAQLVEKPERESVWGSFVFGHYWQGLGKCLADAIASPVAIRRSWR